MPGTFTSIFCVSAGAPQPHFPGTFERWCSAQISAGVDDEFVAMANNYAAIQ